MDAVEEASSEKLKDLLKVMCYQIVELGLRGQVLLILAHLTASFCPDVSTVCINASQM